MLFENFKLKLSIIVYLNRNKKRTRCSFFEFRLENIFSNPESDLVKPK